MKIRALIAGIVLAPAAIAAELPRRAEIVFSSEAVTPRHLSVFAGKAVDLDVVFLQAAPHLSDCHFTLRLIGGELTTLLAKGKISRPADSASSAPKRLPLRIDIPEASAGTRFVLSIWDGEEARSAPVTSAELVVTHPVGAETLRTPANWRVEYEEGSPALRSYLAAAHRQHNLSKSFPPDLDAPRPHRLCLYVGTGSVQVLLHADQKSPFVRAFATKTGAGWLVDARLPHYHLLGLSPKAHEELSATLQFALDLSSHVEISKP